MASLLQVDRVQYVWDDENVNMAPLCRLYFCKHCVEIRSRQNLQNEVDSHFCPQSLDNLASNEAFLKKNKSVNCSKCPSCMHVLSTKATTKPVASDENGAGESVKKFYYLTCTFCRWNSREVGIEDRSVVSGEWQEKEIQDKTRIENLFQHYRNMDLKAKQAMEQQKIDKRRGYSNLKQKYADISKVIKPHPASPYAGLSSLQFRYGDTLNIKEIELEPAKKYGIDDTLKITEDFYRKINLLDTTSLQQRLDQPALQADKVQNLYPQQVTMLIKRSLRCTKCDHNIVKPEYNASSIKFKIVLSALYFIPEIRIFKLAPMYAGQSAKHVFIVRNPTDNVKHITFTSKEPDTKSNATIEMPTNEMKVYSYDETDNFQTAMDDTYEKTSDESDQIVKVKGNKVYFYVTCTPNEGLSSNDDIWVGFSLKYDHVSTIPVILPNTPLPKEQPLTWLTHTVYVNVGKLSDNPI